MLGRRAAGEDESMVVNFSLLIDFDYNLTKMKLKM